MMRQGTQDVAMGGEAEHEDENEMGDSAMPMSESFSTPRRKQQRAGERFNFSVTPEPSRRRLSTSKGGKSAAELEESPARYSPGKVKKAVRSFADFLHFLDEHHQEHELMPIIIQRFAELGAVIESQKRHIDRWKGKELDLAIEEAQQNMELVQALGERIQKQELQIAELTVKRQQWEEKYQLAAQEIEILKKQGTYQIQQLRSEVAMLRQAKAEVDKKWKERETSLQTTKDTLLLQLEQMKRDNDVVKQENTQLKQQRLNQSGETRSLEQQIRELRAKYETDTKKATELEQDVGAWQAKYQEKNHQVRELENTLTYRNEEMRQCEEDRNQLLDQNRKLQEYVDQMAHEHEKRLADQHERLSEVEAERQRLTQALEHESMRFEKFKNEASRARAQIEAQAMAAMKQREHQLLDERNRLEEELQHQVCKLNEEKADLQAVVDNMKDINLRKSAEINRLTTSALEAEQQNQSYLMETRKMQQLTEEATHAKHRVEVLSRDLAAKESAHEEAMKVHSAEFEAQYNGLVSQVENQFNEMKHENEQLRSEIDETVKKLELVEGQSAAEKEKFSTWQTECERLKLQLQEGTREYEALRRELDHRLKELDLRRKENANLSAQMEHSQSSDHEHTKRMEQLQRENLRLEEHNQDLQRLLEETRAQIEALMEEAHLVHDHSVEQQATHENLVRSLLEEKEALNRNSVTLSAENVALEAQIRANRNQVEHWKASVQQLEHDKRQVEYQLQEVMRQATEQIETQKQSAAMVTKDGRSHLQKLTAQLVQRDAQINEGQQQLRAMQETVRLLEEKLCAQEPEMRNLHSKNEELANKLDSFSDEKRGLERKLRQYEVTILREDRSAMNEDLCQRLERYAFEMERQLKQEKDKAVHLQAKLDTKHDIQVRRLSEDKKELIEENARLQQDLENYADEYKRLESDFQQLQQERGEREELLCEMQQSIAAYEEDRHAQDDATDAFRRLDGFHKELTTTHEEFKQKVLAQLEEKEKEMTDLQDDMAELQSKLEQEKEMTRHLMESSYSEKHEHAKKLADARERQRGRVQELETSVEELQGKLRASEQSDADKDQLQARIMELEASVKQLQHELQVSQQSKTAKEQSAMHEILQKEREYRALQSRYDNLTAENTASRKEMEAKLEEIDQLHEEVEHMHVEIERLHEQIESNTLEMDQARGHLNVSEQLTEKLEKLQDELAAREDERRQHDAAMSTKVKELQQARDAEQKRERQLEDTMHEKDGEVEMLKQQNVKLQGQLKQLIQAKVTSDKAHTAEQEIAKSKLEQAYDQSKQREQRLLSQIARLEASKMSLLNQFCHEMRKQDIEIDFQGTGDGKQIDDNAFHRGILEVSALLQSYQERENRQNSVIYCKEEQIKKLKLQLENEERSTRFRDNRPDERDESRGQERSLHEQVKVMSDEVSKLELEDQGLRENRTIWNSAKRNSKWEERCAKLKNRVRVLKDANTKLKENQLSQADMKALVKEIEKLSDLVKEKDMQLQTLRETLRCTKRGSAAANGPRRPRDLLEEKVMVLNDHLTGLMTENMQLQHNVEQYAIRYGPLNNMTSVIGNSGIRVPARTTGAVLTRH